MEDSELKDAGTVIGDTTRGVVTGAVAAAGIGGVAAGGLGYAIAKSASALRGTRRWVALGFGAAGAAAAGWWGGALGGAVGGLNGAANGFEKNALRGASRQAREDEKLARAQDAELQKLQAQAEILEKQNEAIRLQMAGGAAPAAAAAPAVDPIEAARNEGIAVGRMDVISKLKEAHDAHIAAQAAAAPESSPAVAAASSSSPATASATISTSPESGAVTAKVDCTTADKNLGTQVTDAADPGSQVTEATAMLAAQAAQHAAAAGAAARA
ncbi:MAG: hypothetical protein EBR02_01955 [Alphaproteobacteria bacterium]|nr:hypothetical protein [Alphaproteobacteria bacterium]